MYLKTLELSGFKSFPDKTVISFEPGITAIVGANGSGKSNISDAVRWVLGEMSPKSLRSGKMEDVIFNGTAKRRPSSCAEVVITIDNSDSMMKIDYDEVSVSRKLYRSGESEYCINKKKCRLKDVVDLFLNTGIGREGYSIIGQGKISEIISVKGSERRDIFEEAAGISRFRYRKTEANNKLVQVSENSQRIGDILAEVESRLPSLEKQSEKAKRYLELAEEKRRLEVAFWAQRIGVIEQKEALVGKDFAAENAGLERVNGELAEAEAKLDGIYLETQKRSLEGSVLTDEVSAAANERSEISGQLSVLENDVFHFRAQIEGAGENDRQLALAAEQLRRERGELEKRLADRGKTAEEARAAFAGSEEGLKELGEEGERLSGKQDELTENAHRLEELIREKELSRTESRSMSLARTERLGQIDRELEKRRLDREDREKALADAERALDALEDEKDSLIAEKRELSLGRQAAEARLDDADAKKREADLEEARVRQRRDTLGRMEKLLEGFSGSVKEVMNAFERGELGGICGPVSRLISTEGEYVTAIETALGGGIQNIVTENERAAKEAIAFLKRTRSGRATFLPLTTLRPNEADFSSLRHRGFVGSAAELVKYEKKFAPAVKFLLGRTAVADNIDSAAEIAASRSYGLRVVTLDGQLVNAGGSFTGGQTLNKTGILSRSADIKKLDVELDAASKRREAADREYRAACAERDGFTEKLRRIEGKLEELRERISAENSRADVCRELIDGLRMADEALNAELGALRAAGVDEKKLLEKLAEENTRLEREARENDALLAENTARIRELGARREALLAENVRLAGELARQDEALKAASDALEAHAEREEENRQRQRELSLGTERLKERVDEALARSETLKCELERAEREIEQKKAQLEANREKLAQLEKETFSGRARQKELNADRDRRNEVCTELRIKLDQLGGEKRTILSKLAEEYELDRESEELKNVPEGEAERLGGEVRLIWLRKEIRKLGSVNVDAVEEYAATKERYDFLKKQYDDVVTSKDELQKLILSLEKTMREMFVASFDRIRSCFKETFTALFGGGSADIVLTDSDDILNCGIEINVQPPGKLVKNLSLLSGGEQAFVAIALYFAILKVNPTPFCIFDEIESALDEANIYRYADYLKKNCDKTQFVVITHRRGTMEFADVLYGITMQEKGVSDFIRLDAAAIGSERAPVSAGEG